MRSRPVAATVAAFALVLSVAACGDGDEQAGQPPVPTSGPIATEPSPTPSSPTKSTPAPTTTPGARGQDDDEQDKPTKADGPPTRGADRDPIPAAAAKSADLTNFTTALDAADLSSALEAKGPFTVFAPNNDGFAKLGTGLDALLQPAAKDQLANILEFHVVKGEVRAKDLKEGTLLTTLQGTRLRVTRKGSDITIGNILGQAKVVSTDIDAGNGVIHAIDTVMTPKPPEG